MLYVYFAVAAYMVILSFTAIIVTIKDKTRAENREWRVKEKTLLLIAAFGGSLAMFVTMRVIRHKTKHLKFMLGIPVIIILQLSFIIGIIYFTK